MPNIKKCANILGAICAFAFLIMFTYCWVKCLVVYEAPMIHFTVYEYRPRIVVMETVALIYACIWGLWKLGPAVMGKTTPVLG